jgi:hypothetical protein
MSAEQKKPLAIWPQKLLGPAPGLKEINVFCWMAFIAGFLVPAGVLLARQIRSGTPFFRQSVDFVYFYGIGEIAQTHSAAGVYDFPLQLSVFTRIMPLAHGTYGPSPYPPFVPQFFRLFTHMSFLHAYFLWMAISFCLYLSAVLLALREFFPEDRLGRLLFLCFAIALPAFLLNTLANGQLSSVSLFFTVAAILLERRSKPFLGGCALAIVSYKPPLLFLIVPMLIVTRRWKMLVGLISAEGILVAYCGLIGGFGIWPTYVRFLNSFGHASGVYGQTNMRLWKYVDFNALTYDLPGGRSLPGMSALIGLSLAAVVWVAILLWKSADGGAPMQMMAWSIALNWNMLLNVYFPIYDSVVFVIVVILSLYALRALKWDRARQGMIALAVLVFAIGWITEPIAQAHGVQLLTLGFLAFAIAQTVLLMRAIAEKKPAETALVAVH